MNTLQQKNQSENKKLSKNLQESYKIIKDSSNEKSLVEVIKKIKEAAKMKFNESIDISINLFAPKKKNTLVARGFIPYAHSPIQKSLKIAVFAPADKKEEALEAGADIAGLEDLIDQVVKGDTSYDYYIAYTSVVPLITKVARILGPVSKFPNKKNGTITDNIKETIDQLKKGMLQYNADKANIVHAKVGTVKMDAQHTMENIKLLVSEIIKNNRIKPRELIKSIYLSSTMGLSVQLSTDCLKDLIS